MLKKNALANYKFQRIYIYSLGEPPPFERERKREGKAKAILKQSEGKAKAKRTSNHWFLQVFGGPRPSKTASEAPKGSREAILHYLGPS